MPTNCLIQNCSNKPSYNYSIESIPSYCKEHKMDDMIDFDNLRLNSKCNFCNGPGHKYFNMLRKFWFCKNCHNKNRLFDGTEKLCNHQNALKCVVLHILTNNIHFYVLNISSQIWLILKVKDV